MSKLKTEVEIINETVEYYSADPLNRRAIDKKGKCHYITDDGKMCAVGRCLKNASKLKNIMIDADYLDNLDSMLKPKYKMVTSTLFWSDIQCLHDFDVYWTDTGLSERGIKEVEILKQKYS